MTTFTASEVRATADSFRTVIGGERAADMLHAYADRLESDEKVQVGQTLRDEGGHEWPAFLNIRDTKLHDDMGGLGQHIYTTAGCGYKTMKYIRQDAFHPAPADAERLAEALRELLGDIDLVKCDFCKCHTWCSVEDSRKSLTKHEAHSAQAQSPAASVTDEMVERARSAFVQADDGSTGVTDAIRAALLAAQENPNGL